VTAEFRLLGNIEVLADDRPVDLGHLRQRCVLLALLLEANRIVSVDQLVDRVWARPPHRARETLYGYLHRLRKALADVEGVDIARQSGGYSIAVDETRIDVYRFRELVRQAHATNEDFVASALFEQALSLWRGEAFAGVDTRWVNGARDTLSKERFAAQLHHTDLLLRQGRHAELVTELTARATEHRWDERLAGQLMLALYRSGRQADALAYYERTRTELADELGIDPGPALRRLHQQILTADPALIPHAPPESPVDERKLERELATAVARQWTAEAESRSLRRPAPVRVRWSTTGRPVTTASGQRSLCGDFTDVATKFRALPTRQLVVLGEPGAGKTVLAILLVLGLLADPKPGDPIPVLLPPSSWDPCREHVHTWLARTLVAEYPGLGAKAAQLVADGRVIPILDGLDELPPGLHSTAIDTLDQAMSGGRPLVVTCRSTEYENAVRRSGAVLAEAAVVEIEPVELDDAITFLTARQRVGDARWQPVAECLRQDREGPLAQTLRTPLMVDLTRTAYHHPTTNPAELLDTTRFPDRVVIETHLIDSFLPAAYPHQQAPPTRTTKSRYRPEQAQRWLGFLALHLRRLQTRDFAWWQLGRALPRRTRGFVLGLPAASLFAIIGYVVAGPTMALVYGLATALAGVVTHGKASRSGPVRVEACFRGTLPRFLARFTAGVLISLVTSLAWSLPVGVMLLLAMVFGFGLGVHVWLAAPTEVNRVSSPGAALTQDRVAALALALSLGLMLGLFYAFFISTSPPADNAFHLDRALACVVSALFGWFAFGWLGSVAFGLAGFVIGGAVMVPHHIPLELGLVIGGTLGLAVGLTAALTRAWGSFALSRIWLALRGHIPLRLNRFLADAHQRGVLRQAGAVYQFRHALLQDRLANTTASQSRHR
jgi:DNA-binding SARP family transcriptional activator